LSACPIALAARERAGDNGEMGKTPLPRTTTAAFLVIDLLQDYFRDGPLAERRAALVQSVNELVAAFHSHGQPVIWVRQEFNRDLSDAFLEMKRRNLSVTISGTDGCNLLPELNYDQGDIVVVKKRYSAFFSTDLDRILARLSPAMLVVSGINTHACIRTTVIDAYQRDYSIIVADDCIASHDQEHHEITKRYLNGKMADFLPNDQIINRLSNGSA
jgi:nicotinamidase-related amidase